MKILRSKRLMIVSSLAVVGSLVAIALASDHADTPQIAARPGTDITDVFMFPSPQNAANVVLVMTVNPLITAATKNSVSFDPDVLYQFKIDNTGDNVEDLVIQARFEGTGAGQRVLISGPVQPTTIGTIGTAMTPYSTKGTINGTFSPSNGMQVFCGVREDPFFFDLEQFFKIFPDRQTPLNSVAIPTAEANVPKDSSWRPAGQAVDFLSNGGYDVLAIVVELPKSMIGGATNKVGLWTTTSVRN